MRSIYNELQRETLEDTPEMVGYEMTVTLNQAKYNNWLQGEKNSFDQLIKLVKQSMPERFMIFQEHHQNGWTHFHGSVWWNSRKQSNICLLNKLNKKMGRSYLTQSKDGKIPDTVTRRYENWFDYLMKESDLHENRRYISDIDDIHVYGNCICKNKPITSWYKIIRSCDEP